MDIKIGSIVKIDSKTSRNDGAIGVVVGHCNGRCPGIVRVQINKRKVINICGTNLRPITEQNAATGYPVIIDEHRYNFMPGYRCIDDRLVVMLIDCDTHGIIPHIAHTLPGITPSTPECSYVNSDSKMFGWLNEWLRNNNIAVPTGRYEVYDNDMYLEYKFDLSRMQKQ